MGNKERAGYLRVIDGIQLNRVLPLNNLAENIMT